MLNIYTSAVVKMLKRVMHTAECRQEARAYAEAAGWDSSDIGFIATRLCRAWPKFVRDMVSQARAFALLCRSLVPMAGKKPHRKIVITQGDSLSKLARENFS